MPNVPRVKPEASTKDIHPRLMYFMDKFMELNGGPVLLSEGNRLHRQVKDGATNTKHNVDEDGWVRALDFSVKEDLNIPKETAVEELRKQFPGWDIGIHTRGAAEHIHVTAPPLSTRARQFQKAYDDGKVDKENPAVQQLVLRGLLVDRGNPMQSINGRRALNLQEKIDAGKVDLNHPAVQSLAQKGFIKLPTNDNSVQNIEQPSPVPSTEGPGSSGYSVTGRTTGSAAGADLL